MPTIVKYLILIITPFHRSPGYALTLLAESTTSAIHSSEAVSVPSGSTSGEAQITPEDIALLAARSLLAEVARGGCVDRKHQPLMLIMMVLGSEDVGRCRMGELSPRSYVFFPTLSNLDTNIFPAIQNTSAERHSRLLWHVIQNSTSRTNGPRVFRDPRVMLWDWVYQFKQGRCLDGYQILLYTGHRSLFPHLMIIAQFRALLQTFPSRERVQQRARIGIYT